MNTLYRKFIQDDIEEANKEMYKYLGKEYITEEDDIDDTDDWDDNSDELSVDKNGIHYDRQGKKVYRLNFYLKKALMDTFVTPVLSKPSGKDALIDFTGTFIDEHYNALSAPGPIFSFTFGNKQTNELYGLFNLDKEKVYALFKQMIDESYFGTLSQFIDGWVRNAPHKILITAIIMYGIQNKDTDIQDCGEYLLAFTEYPILYRHYWPIGVKEDVMIYTLEHLGKKNIVNRVKNLKELLKYDGHKAVECVYGVLAKGYDHSYVEILRRLRNGINSKFKNISKMYHYYYENQATQHQNVSVFDDGELADQEGQSTNIAQIVDKTIGKFSLKDINQTMIGISANNAEVDKGLLSSFISQIYNTKNNKVPKLVENIITAFFTKNPTETTINSATFLTFGLALYRSIGTSKDPLYSEIKDILNFWMNDIINIREQYKREATIIAYTKAIFNYIILMIKYYN